MERENIPFVSIIVAVFNGEKTLQKCIDSIATQTYPNKQLIIIDGGSKDGTVDLLKANQEKVTYWISEPDKGIYNAWNKGLLQAKGEWICFLGADDYFWNDQVLERMSEQLATMPPKINVAYGQIMLINPEGENIYTVGEPWEAVKEQFKQVMSIPHPGAMHRRELFEKQGNFDESFRIAGDYELLLRELKTADAYFMPGIISVAMQQGGVSSSPENALYQLREVRRAQSLHLKGLPGRLWIMSIVRLYIRLLLWRILGERLARKALDIGRRVMGLPAFWTKV
jgi:glycosyltransferase involved in cell wall biosynthesis